MDEEFTISTPEQVAFHYETAGIGSRFVASLLDHLIIFSVLFFLTCAAFSLIPALGAAASLGEEAISAGAYLVLAILVLINFLVFWGYFALFEIVWQGRTPGKRAGRLRVIRESGQPIGAGESIVRNLVRIVDFLPVFYGVGLITMFINKDSRRLGDFAAGTIVVRESEEVGLHNVRVSEPVPSYTPSSSYPAPYSWRPASETLSPQSSVLSPRYDPLPGVSLRDVTPDDYRLIREMLERVRRGELQRDRARELSTRLAYGVASRMGQDFREWQSQGWDPLTFLESVLQSRDARGA
jgi:uncharacterized RDD family membrane protein YckC